MPVPNTFANATATIPLSQLDANFATTITLGNTAIQLGNTVSTLNNMTLANVTVTSGNVTITNVTVTTANVTTANIATAVITTANVTTANITTGNVSGNLTFTGTGNRILGDFSNATIANRTMFQNSVTNANSQLGLLPNGTGTSSNFAAHNASDPTNASRARMQVSSTLVSFESDITGTGTYLPMTFYTGGSERMRIDTSGNLGLGVTPSAWGTSGSARSIQVQLAALSFRGAGNTDSALTHGAYYDGTNWRYTDTSIGATRYQMVGANAGSSHSWSVSAGGTAGNAITFTQAMTLDASGNLGIGQTSPAFKLDVQVATGGAAAIRPSASTGNALQSALRLYGHESVTTSRYVQIGCFNDTAGTDTNAMLFYTGLGTAITERARITSGGEFLVGKTASDITVAGAQLLTSGAADFTRSGGYLLAANRLTNDGDLVIFQQANVTEGTISVSGNTVSYNPFLGSHAGAFADWSRPEVKIGTIFETINELIDYKVVVIEVEDVPKRISYNGNGAVGTTATVEYEGQEYTGIIENERGQLRDFNKHVKVKINDTPDSKAVYGVFVGWNTDPSNDGGVYNDMLIGAVGNYVIRMASGQTPEIGDLVKADGTGCAIVQEDDIVRTKTVGKITNTIPQLTYEDGSFLVACVLYCG